MRGDYSSGNQTCVWFMHPRDTSLVPRTPETHFPCLYWDKVHLRDYFEKVYAKQLLLCLSTNTIGLYSFKTAFKHYKLLLKLYKNPLSDKEYSKPRVEKSLVQTVLRRKITQHVSSRLGWVRSSSHIHTRFHFLSSTESKHKQLGVTIFCLFCLCNY